MQATIDLNRLRPWLARLLLAVLTGATVGAGWVLAGPAGPAAAHAVLVSTSPPRGAVVAVAPTQVVLTFSESVQLVAGKIQVVDPSGKRVAIGTPKASGPQVTIPLGDGDLPRGTFLVSYRVVSADSHPVAGGFSFSIGAPSDGAPQASGGNGVDPVVKVAVPVAKYLGYAGLVLLVGPILALGAFWPRRLPRRGPTRLAWAGLGLIGLSTVLALLLQAPYSTGGAVYDIDPDALVDALSSQFGTVLAIRLGILVAVAILLRPVAGGEGGRTDHLLLAVLGAVGLATWPLAGHPGASSAPAVTTIADTAHLASMAVWLGGLVMLAGFLLRQADARELDAIWPVWSRWAAFAVAWLVLGGLVQALVEVGSLDVLVSTDYGRLIMVKAGLLLGVVGVAGYARRLVQRRQAAGEPRRMSRMVLAELGGTAVILALSAVLVQTTPARTEAQAPDLTDSSYFAQTLTNSLYSLEVQIDPARVGSDSVHLYAYEAGGKPLPVIEWKASAALPAQNLEPIDIPLLKLADNHSIGEVTLPTAGDWVFRFTLRTSDVDQATVSATVPVR